MSFFQNLLKRYVPMVKADDEEIVDPQQVLRGKCSAEPKCASLQGMLDTCTDRVNSRTQTEETCLEELIDYIECVDHCVAETLFTKLK
ncbi:cytochrome b-c1 complex subunit 6, mitochondrial-like [Ceratina calcarata]|uniref:Cytochrome b-c1 complex subunit 6 n=1 Tax=Ceratina calcarata TaxID=156304 RepID=A0AAJ7N9J0_9HYME|nr:cytochrome b-c1 complex subunit 6, mitochondrial-like [Ceratina calcarata]